MKRLSTLFAAAVMVLQWLRPRQPAYVAVPRSQLYAPAAPAQARAVATIGFDWGMGVPDEPGLNPEYAIARRRSGRG